MELIPTLKSQVQAPFLIALDIVYTQELIVKGKGRVAEREGNLKTKTQKQPAKQMFLA